MIPRFDFRYSIRDFITELKYFGKTYAPEVNLLQNYFGGFPLIFVAGGRIGIALVLRALGLKPGSSIGVQPFTCSSVLFAIQRAGFKIVFIDIDHNFRLSHTDLILKSHRIEALIVTHTFGYPENVDELKSVLGNKPVIEDCAQAFLSEINGKPVGLSGEAGVFSLGYGKLFGIGSGGFIVSKNSTFHLNLVKEFAKLSSQNSIRMLADSLKSLLLGALYNPAVYNSVTYPMKRITRKKRANLQVYPDKEQSLSYPRVSLFESKFRDAVREVRLQQENGRMLRSLIDNRFQSVSLLNGSSPNFFLLPYQSKNRESIIEYLRGKGIESGKHFSQSVNWVRNFGYTDGSCPDFESIAGEVFTLPCHYYLSEKKIRFIAETLNNYHEEF